MFLDVELKCGPCRLRAMRREDAGVLAVHANNRKVAMYLRDRFPYPYAEEDALRFLDYAISTSGEVLACIDVNGEGVGMIGIQFRTDIERCSGELGYWLGEPFWGRGIMTAAITTFTGWAMPRFELTRVYAEVFAENPSSARVLEKAGFNRVGVLHKAAIKHDRYHDYVLYDLIR